MRMHKMQVIRKILYSLSSCLSNFHSTRDNIVKKVRASLHEALIDLNWRCGESCNLPEQPGP